MANIMQHDALAKTEQGQRNNQKHLNDQWRMGEERRAQLEEEKASIKQKSQNRRKKHELKHILLPQTPIKKTAKHAERNRDAKRKQIREVIVQKHEQYQRQ